MTYNIIVTDVNSDTFEFENQATKATFAADGSLTLSDEDGEMLFPSGQVVNIRTSVEEDEPAPRVEEPTPEQMDLTHPYNDHLTKPWWHLW